MATITFRLGKGCRAHNLRMPRIVESQTHIDPNGIHEIWKDETEALAYKRLFQSAVDAYNQKQIREDRRITNYFAKIQKSAQQNASYEAIVGVYGDDCDPKTGYKILRRYYEEWRMRNPHIELIGAFYHADEVGDPHLHLTLVPVGDGYTTGMETRASLRRALEQQGFAKDGKQTAQIAWERSEREYLESLCVDQGLTVEHPGGHAKHLSVSEYKESREMERQERIADAAIELHEKKALGGTRVTVDADGLQTLKNRSRALMIYETEPGLRTRSAIAAQRQKELLMIESDLYERERRLEEAQRVLTQQRDEWEKEKEVQQTAISIMTSLLATISKAVRELLDRFPLPKPCRDVLSRLTEKIDAVLGVDTTSRADRDYDTHR